METVITTGIDQNGKPIEEIVNNDFDDSGTDFKPPTERKVIDRTFLVNRLSYATLPRLIELKAIQADAWFKPMTGAERDAYEAYVTNSRAASADNRLKLDNIRARLIAHCLCAEDGTRLFDPHKPVDVIALGNQDAKLIQEMFLICQDLCGLNEAAIKALQKK